MGVGIRVGHVAYVIGERALLRACFDTIAVVLERGERGGRFPILSCELYAGAVDAEDVEQLAGACAESLGVSILADLPS